MVYADGLDAVLAFRGGPPIEFVSILQHCEHALVRQARTQAAGKMRRSEVGLAEQHEDGSAGMALTDLGNFIDGVAVAVAVGVEVAVAVAVAVVFGVDDPVDVAVAVGFAVSVAVTVGVAVAVAVTVAVGLAVPVAVAVAVGVGVGKNPACSSKAPMSHAVCPGAGRGSPRWSVVIGVVPSISVQ